MFHYSLRLFFLSLRVQMLFLPCLPFVCFHFFEQVVKALEVAFPNSAVLLQPHFKLLKRLRLQRINAALRIDANANQSGGTGHPQMLGI
jgi:hypothetical protein